MLGNEPLDPQSTTPLATTTRHPQHRHALGGISRSVITPFAMQYAITPGIITREAHFAGY
jgi:hypothetical protein